MDTHITDADLAHAGAGLVSPIGLPGEGSPSTGPFSAGERLGANSSPEAHGPDKTSTLDPAIRIRRARRNALLAGVAAVVLVGAVGAGLYAFRDDIRNDTLTHRLTAMISSWTSKLPSAPMEAGLTAYPIVAAARTKPVQTSDAANVTPVLPADSTATLAREFAALQSFSKPKNVAPVALEAGLAPAPLAVAVAPSSSGVKPAQLVTPSQPMPLRTSAPAPQEAGVVLPTLPVEPNKAPQATLSATPASSPDSPAASVVGASPAARMAPAAPAPTPIVVSREPAAIASELKAGSMTSAQQVEVVGLVKSLGAQLRDTRIEVVQLHQVVIQLSEKMDTRTMDFENRLGLAEASAIVQSSARAGSAALPSEATASPPPATSTTQPVRLASVRNSVPLPAAPAPTPERRTVKDYVVKGASPGLAILAALNPLPGSSSVIEVGVGDPVPGVGRIKRVYQRGTTWIVETDSGSIQQ